MTLRPTASALRRLTAAVGMATALFVARPAQAEPIIGLTTSNQIFAFDSATPGVLTTPLTIVGGIVGDLVGIDRRPVNGLVYGLTADGANVGRIYTIDTTTGLATLVSTLSVPLSASDFYGIDFNPAADRLRVVSGSGVNLRINVATGATITDTNLNGAAASAEFAAYTNNFAGTVATTLHVGNTLNDSLYIQNPPNNGTLVLTGAFGQDVLANGDIDISGLSGIAYGVFNIPGAAAGRFYTVNLATGAITFVGTIAGNAVVRGLAAPVGVAVPEPGVVALLGLAVVGAIRWRRRR